jgi:ParB-like chromosome segregation protein Spo0J
MPITKQLLRIPLDTLVPYERNTKIHSENIDDIIKSIERNEYITPIIIDEENIILA